MKIYTGINRPTKKQTESIRGKTARECREFAAKYQNELALRDFVGCVTIRNPKTGNHRTFRIRRQPDDAKFAPGQRIVSLLTGPDNEADYTGFAFLTDAGHLCMWKKYRDSTAFNAYRKMLEQPERYRESHGLEYAVEKRCARCFRRLTTPESISRGLGPECAEAMKRGA